MTYDNYCAGCDSPIDVADGYEWDNDTDLCRNCLDTRVTILEAKDRRLTEALQASTKALAGMQEERNAYKQCLQLYADHDNWGCSATSSHNHDCESQPEQCCWEEWQGPVGVHGYEEAERVIREHQAENEGGDAL